MIYGVIYHDFSLFFLFPLIFVFWIKLVIRISFERQPQMRACHHCHVSTQLSVFSRIFHSVLESRFCIRWVTSYDVTAFYLSGWHGCRDLPNLNRMSAVCWLASHDCCTVADSDVINVDWLAK